MTIEQRLTQLERKNRRLTLVLVLAGLAVILAVAVGMAAPEAVLEEVKAQKFILVDGDGKFWGGLGVDKTGSNLILIDENGKGRVWLGMFDGRPQFFLDDENGKTRARLSLAKDSSPNLFLSDKNENVRAMLTVAEVGPFLALRDADGRVLRKLP